MWFHGANLGRGTLCIQDSLANVTQQSLSPTSMKGQHTSEAMSWGPMVQILAGGTWPI